MSMKLIGFGGCLLLYMTWRRIWERWYQGCKTSSQSNSSLATTLSSRSATTKKVFPHSCATISRFSALYRLYSHVSIKSTRRPCLRITSCVSWEIWKNKWKVWSRNQLNHMERNKMLQWLLLITIAAGMATACSSYNDSATCMEHDNCYWNPITSHNQPCYLLPDQCRHRAKPAECVWGTTPTCKWNPVLRLCLESNEPPRMMHKTIRIENSTSSPTPTPTNQAFVPDPVDYGWWVIAAIVCVGVVLFFVTIAVQVDYGRRTGIQFFPSAIKQK